MTPEQFDALVKASKAACPSWFDQVEEPGSEEQLSALERALNMALPEEFRGFATGHGAGYFGRAIIFSVDPTSEWYLLDAGPSELVSRGFVAFSDDEAGGYYGFRCQLGACDTVVFYWYPDEADAPQQVAVSFYDWVTEFALPAEQSNDR